MARHLRLLLVLLCLFMVVACRAAHEPTVQIVAITALPAGLDTTPAPTAVDAGLPWLARAAPTATGLREPTPSPATRSPVPSVTPGRTPAPPGPTLPARAVPTVRAGPAQRDDAALLNVIREALGADEDNASVVVRRLTDGAGAAWRPTEVYYAASLYKLAVLYEAFRQRQAGTIQFDQTMALTGSAAGEDLGTFDRVQREADGSVRVGEAVRAMVTWSDNVSAALLLDLLGHRQIDATLAGLGLTATSVNTTELPTTAADMARLMEAVVRGDGLGGQAAAEMTALLLHQETRDGIPRGVPAGVPVGDKWGAWPGATHDVAFVVAPHGAYVLAVLTTEGWNWNLIARVSRAVWTYWEGDAH